MAFPNCYGYSKAEMRVYVSFIVKPDVYGWDQGTARAIVMDSLAVEYIIARPYSYPQPLCDI